MTSELVVMSEYEKSVVELEETQKLCAQLMKTPHYARMGEVGIYTIVQKARSIGLSPMEALNGGVYFVQGKVELSSNTMNYLIRRAGHSIVKDEASTDDCCILRGKRADNGDTWTASFSVAEAKKAGIYKGVWEKYTSDMLFARALTRLGRQLFPDVLKGCYVEGEIRASIEAEKAEKGSYAHFDQELAQKPAIVAEIESVTKCNQPMITKTQAEDLVLLLNDCSREFRDTIKTFCGKQGVTENLENLPESLYERLLKATNKNLEECKAALQKEEEQAQ
jgi:hypothetical protein